MSDYELPEYRVRLFLAVDLSNSTAFKNNYQNPIDWVPTFQDFYSGFAQTFISKFNAICEKNYEKCSTFSLEQPKVWKTIGDEIVFANRVNSFAQVLAYCEAFIQAMKSYSEKLRAVKKTESLDVKGNAWLASFPYPNQTIDLFGNSEISNEAVEKGADEKPQKYEFLGSGIDAGFRIAKNSDKHFFTVSPALAGILCAPKQNVAALGCFGNFELQFKGTTSLKGVISEKPYPIIGINTERDEKMNGLRQKIDYLNGITPTDAVKLGEFIAEFEQFHNIKSPKLKVQPTDNEPEAPTYYSETFVDSWKSQLKLLQEQKALELQSAEKDEGEIAPEASVEALVSELKSKP